MLFDTIWLLIATISIGSAKRSAHVTMQVDRRFPNPSGLSKPGTSPAARAKNILESEPTVDLTAEMKRSFSTGINQRPKLSDCTTCTAAHGTSLAALVSMLQNTNGQVTTGERRKELGIITTSGEARTNDPGRKESDDWALGMDLLKPRLYLIPEAGRNASGDWEMFADGKRYRSLKWHPVKDCLHFARASTGWGTFNKKAELVINSEAAQIPVVLVGDMVQDPEAPMAGANYQLMKVANLEKWVPAESVPAQRETYVTEVYGKALNVRGVYVFGDLFEGQPTAEDVEEEFVLVVRELVQQISKANDGIYDDIYVGQWSKEIASFMKAFPMEAFKMPSAAELEAHLFPN